MFSPIYRMITGPHKICINLRLVGLGHLHYSMFFPASYFCICVCGFCICNFVFWLWLLVLVLLITSLWIYVIVTLILILVVMMQVMWLELEVEGCSNGLFWSLNYASSPPKRDQGLHFLLRRVFTSSFYAKKNDSDQHPILVSCPNPLLWNCGNKTSQLCRVLYFQEWVKRKGQSSIATQ